MGNSKLKIQHYLLIILILGFLSYFFLFKKNWASGDEAPAISAELIDGAEFNLEDLRGNYVLLDFWASWCGPCFREAPEIVSLHKDFHGQPFIDAEDFKIVSIALEKNDKYWRNAAKRLGFNWDYQIVETVRFVRMSEIASDYGVTEIPSKFLIGPASKIILVNPEIAEIRHLLESKLQD